MKNYITILFAKTPFYPCAIMLHSSCTNGDVVLDDYGASGGRTFRFLDNYIKDKKVGYYIWVGERTEYAINDYKYDAYCIKPASIDDLLSFGMLDPWIDSLGR